MPTPRPALAAAIAIPILSVTLLGCTAGPQAAPAPAASSTPQELDEASPPPTAGAGQSSAAPSCDTIGAAIAPFVSGLAAQSDDDGSDGGADCDWEAPPGVTDPAAVRSIGVTVEEGAQTPLTPAEVQQAGMRVISDAAVQAKGGIAYTTDTAGSTDTGTGADDVIITTITLPNVEVVVSGGRWPGYPALDGPAAATVANRILGL